MDNPFLKLTVTDRQILNSYALMLNGLVHTLVTDTN